MHATGKTEPVTAALKVTLKPAVPQGINPKILVLVVHVQKPSDPHIQPVMEKTVHYEQQPVSVGEYTEAHIDNGDNSFSLTIEVVE